MTEPLTTSPRLSNSEEFLPELGWDFDVEIYSRAYFRYGLPGFEHLNKFIIASVKDFPPFYLLISKEEPQVNLLIIHTKLLSIYSSIEIPEAELKKVGTRNRGDVDAYVVVKINAKKNTLTVNLRAPILIHKKSHAAYQAILDRGDLSAEYPLVPA